MPSDLPPGRQALACPEVQPRLHDLLAGALDEPARAAVGAHLEACPQCQARLEEARVLAEVLQEAPAPAPPQDLVARINSAALTHLRFQRRPVHQKAIGSPAFFATCASLLCGALICLLAIYKVSSVAMPAVDVAQNSTLLRVLLGRPVTVPAPPAAPRRSPEARPSLSPLAAFLSHSPAPPSVVEYHAALGATAPVGALYRNRLHATPLPREKLRH